MIITVVATVAVWIHEQDDYHNYLMSDQTYVPEDDDDNKLIINYEHTRAI